MNNARAATTTTPIPKNHITSRTTGWVPICKRDHEIQQNNPHAIHEAQDDLRRERQRQRDSGFIRKQEAADQLARLRRQHVVREQTDKDRLQAQSERRLFDWRQQLLPPPRVEEIDGYLEGDREPDPAPVQRADVVAELPVGEFGKGPDQ